jgi:hypothetical protein
VGSGRNPLCHRLFLVFVCPIRNRSFVCTNGTNNGFGAFWCIFSALVHHPAIYTKIKAKKVPSKGTVFALDNEKSPVLLDFSASRRCINNNVS